ncbi:MAG: hypothetical protein HUK17_07115 [Bacteroidales bacterium]|nr:hypothetical protein [Bacteroidales bacterium]
MIFYNPLQGYPRVLIWTALSFGHRAAPLQLPTNLLLPLQYHSPQKEKKITFYSAGIDIFCIFAAE